MLLNVYLLFHNAVEFQSLALRKFEVSFISNDIETMNSKNEPMQMFLGMNLDFVTGSLTCFIRSFLRRQNQPNFGDKYFYVSQNFSSHQ